MKKGWLALMLVTGAALLYGCELTATPAATATPSPTKMVATMPTEATSAPDKTSAPTGVATPTAVAIAEYRKISAEDARSILQGSTPYVLLDVRTQEEYEQAHIEGAILIPDTEILSRAPEELPDKGAAILVYCRSGRRSALAAKALVGMGYTGVYDFGGIIDWPYDTVSGPMKED